MLQSAQQCRYSILGETNPKDDQDFSLSHELLAVVKGHGDWSLKSRNSNTQSILSIESVMARWLEVCAQCT